MNSSVTIASPLAQVKRTLSQIITPKAKRFPAPPLSINMPDSPTADQILLVARVRALEARLRLRNPRRQPAIIVLLQGAVDAGMLDIAKGEVALTQATDAYMRGLQTVNRGMYALGATIGALLALLISALLVLLAQMHWPPLKNLTEPANLASLCFYSVAGSLTSIMTRLTKMDLKDEESRLFVAFSAMIQPFIALGLMSVIYVVFEFNMLGISLTSSNPEKAVWVVAFLCGFSERFAPGLLDGLTAKINTSGK